MTVDSEFQKLIDGLTDGLRNAEAAGNQSSIEFYSEVLQRIHEDTHQRRAKQWLSYQPWFVVNP